MVSPTAVAMLARAIGGRQRRPDRPACGPRGPQRGGGPEWPARTLAAVVGQGSRDALAEHGLAPARLLVPTDGADADALLAEPALLEIAGWRVLVLRGETGRDDVAATLVRRGATVDELRAYRRVDAPWTEAAARALAEAATPARTRCSCSRPPPAPSVSPLPSPTAMPRRPRPTPAPRRALRAARSSGRAPARRWRCTRGSRWRSRRPAGATRARSRRASGA
jgi:hypothetical protein